MTHRWSKNSGRRSQARRKTKSTKVPKAQPMPAEPSSLTIGDSGFCNPYKIAADADTQEGKLADIESRGWTPDEARMMLRDGE